MSLQQGEDALRFVFQEEHFGDISVHELGGEGWRARSYGQKTSLEGAEANWMRACEGTSLWAGGGPNWGHTWKVK